MRVFLVVSVLFLALWSAEAGTTLFVGPKIIPGSWGDHFGAVTACDNLAVFFGGNRVGPLARLALANPIAVSSTQATYVSPKSIGRDVSGNVAVSIGNTQVYTVELYQNTTRSDVVMAFTSNCTSIKWRLQSQFNVSSLGMPGDLLDVSAAVVAGRYPVWAGGERAQGGVSGVAVVLDSVTNQTSALSLGVARGGVAGVTATDGTAWFGGGADRSKMEVYDTVDVIYSNITIDSTTYALSEPRGFLAGASTKGVVAFAGGVSEYIDRGNGTIEAVYSSTVDLFRLASKTRFNATLSVARGGLTATATDQFIVFAGGVTRTVYNASTWEIIEEDSSPRVDIYHVPSNTWAVTQLASARTGLTSVGMGNIFVASPGSYRLPNGTLEYTATFEWFQLSYASPAASLRPASLYSFLLSFFTAN